MNQPIEPKKTLTKVIKSIYGPEVDYPDGLDLYEFVKLCEIKDVEELKWISVYQGTNYHAYGSYEDYYQFQYRPEIKYENPNYEKECEVYIDEMVKWNKSLEEQAEINRQNEIKSKIDRLYKLDVEKQKLEDELNRLQGDA